MKIIFLDFDGVLNHQDWYRRRMDEIRDNEIFNHYPFYEFDPDSVNQLNRIIELTGAKVVVSSTWRLGRTVSELQEILDKVGFIGEIVDITPSFYASGTDNDNNKINYTVPRGCEIEWWLKEKGKFQRINWSREQQIEYLEKAVVKNYVILDDDSDMLYCQREHYVKCNAYGTGLDEATADKAIKILNQNIIQLYY
jgi:hypothetical protein